MRHYHLRHDNPLHDEFTLEQLVSMAASDARISTRTHEFEHLTIVARQFEKAVEVALRKYVRKNRNVFSSRLGSVDDIVDALMNERNNEAPFLYFMELEGHGVGTWDGDWNKFYAGSAAERTTAIDEMSLFMHKHVRAEYSRLSDAIYSAAEAGVEQPDDEDEDEDDDYYQYRRGNPEGEDQPDACDRARVKFEKACVNIAEKRKGKTPKAVKPAKAAKAEKTPRAAKAAKAEKAPRAAKAPREPKAPKTPKQDHKYGLYDTPDEAHREAESLARTVIPTNKFQTLPQFVRALVYKPRPAKASTPRTSEAPDLDVSVAGVDAAIKGAIEAPLAAVGASAADLEAAAGAATVTHMQHPEDKMYFAVTPQGEWGIAHGKRDSDVLAKLKKQGFRKATVVIMPQLVSGEATRDAAYANMLDTFAERFCGKWNRSKATTLRKSVAQVDAALEQDQVKGPSLIPEMVAMPDQPEVTYSAPAESAGPVVVPRAFEEAPVPKSRGGSAKAEPRVRAEARPSRAPRPERAAPAPSQPAAGGTDLASLLKSIEATNRASLNEFMDSAKEGLAK